jgi:phage tail protein X
LQQVIAKQGETLDSIFFARFASTCGLEETIKMNAHLAHKVYFEGGEEVFLPRQAPAPRTTHNIRLFG